MSRGLFVATAAGGFLSSVAPLVEDGDNMLSGEPTHVILVLLPVALLILAAIATGSSPSAAGLGGGAALALASWYGCVSIIGWKIIGDLGEYGGRPGVGMYLTTATALLALVTAFAALRAPRGAGNSGVLVVVLLAAFLMSLGCTLVPSELADRGMSWGDYNGFGLDKALGIATQLLIWMPVVGALIALGKGGRFGALYALGAAHSVAWLVVAVQTEVFNADDYSNSEFIIIDSKLHPLALIGAVLVGLFAVVAIATSGGAPASFISAPVNSYFATPPGAMANPARWASDPLGRHEMRYWDGTRWTEHVADAGVSAIDHGHDRPAQAPTIAVPVQAAAWSAPLTASTTLAPVREAPLVERTACRPQPLSARFEQQSTEIVFHDGQRVAVATPLLIGRDPRAVANAPLAIAFAIADPTMSVSATHLLVGPEAGGVWVEDLGSTNGTEVVHTSREVQQLNARVRASVPVGSQIRFGECWLHVVRAGEG